MKPAFKYCSSLLRSRHKQIASPQIGSPSMAPLLSGMSGLGGSGNTAEISAASVCYKRPFFAIPEITARQ
jgi:hypothetical protein